MYGSVLTTRKAALLWNRKSRDRERRYEGGIGAKKLKGKNVGISAYFPKETIQRRKKKMQHFNRAKEKDRTVSFSVA